MNVVSVDIRLARQPVYAKPITLAASGEESGESRPAGSQDSPMI